MLTGKDKVLMKMYLEDGKTFGEMARLAGVNEGTIARILRGEYMMCLHGGEGLSGFERAVAKDYFLEGLSQRQIARKREVTVYQVRKALRRLQALVNSEMRRKDDDADV
jgi:DNA-directed RNA polymerase specialized sigma subunit